MFHRHSIRSRMNFILTLMLTLFAGMAYLSYNSTQIAKSIGTESAAEQMLADQQAKIKVASHTIALAVGHAIEGVEQDAEKIEVIRNLISDIRFEADKSGYYFVYHDTTVVALPPKPSLQGKDLKGLKDKNGVHPIAELWEKAKKGGGFIQYVWPKPGAGDTPKLGYAEMIPGTKFWIGTGVYIDNVQIAQGEIASKIDGVVNQRLTITLIICGVIFLLGIVPLSLMVTQSIVGPLRRIADGLNLGADQVASASGQVSDTGQVLAAGASEQASNIEETAASLEEMESTTMKNAENANESNSIVKESIHDIGTANQLMSQLTTSMQEISTASEETSKIIKTIDEIAFQTNLLALNAAVEAARAGEAGAGFAVVADEVRNLAMRSAEAAKNTSEIIQDTVVKVGQGSDILARTSESFSTVEGRSQKMAELVEEIAAASGEQARGIKQINSAVTQMDNVVQQNAANAEESASAAEELSAQAEQLKDMVNSLTKVVDGQNHGGKRVKSTPRPKRRRASAPAAMSTPRPAPVATEPTPAAAPVKEVSPEQLIPLDDDDFNDF